jgi:alkanesulfonate monooxygenase SsuD/methylene tetrahydromethanopterin reductase-like flavin-dependent oxidoreductase (luciferase family)
VYTLPLYNPLRLLEEIYVLDAMSDGRIVPGIGRGVRDVEHEWFGLDPRDAQARFEEAAEVLRQGLQTGRIDFSGRFYTFDDVDLPWSQGRKKMQVFYAGSLEFAARNGLSALGTSVTRDAIDGYWRRLEAEVREPEERSRRLVGNMRHIVVGTSHAEAEEDARRAWAVLGDHLWATDVRSKGKAVTRGAAGIGYGGTLEDARNAGQVVYGTAASVTDDLHAFLDSVGDRYNYLVLSFQWGDISHTAALRSMTRFTEDVRPALERRG